MNKRFTANPARAARVNGSPPDRTTGEPLTRAAAVVGWDADALTIGATIATASPVRRRDGRGPFLEILAASGMRPVADDDDRPLLDGHRQSGAAAVIGRVFGIRAEGDAIVGTLRLSGADDVAPVRQRIADGTLRAVSAGYRVHAWAEGRAEDGSRTKTATDWDLVEVSAVAVPADSAARLQREIDMEPDETIEQTPAETRAEIRAIGRAAGMTAEAVDALIDDDATVTEARAAAFEHMQTRQTPRIRVVASNDDPAQVRERQTAALACRMSGEAPDDEARPFMTMGLGDLARDALQRSGVSVAAMSREEILSRAMHGISDFPELLTGAGNRVLSTAYQRAASPVRQLARQRTVQDFRPLSVLKIGEFGPLQKVSEAGEITHTTTAEAKEGYSLETFGRMFSLSRKAIVNDDLGAFGRWSEMMGQAAAETEAAQLVGLLTANSGGGVKMSDTKNLFHADHGNLADTPGALGDTTLSAARLALRTQKGLDGSTPVGVTPKFLVVGPALETAAEKLLATIYAAEIDNANPFAGRLTLLVEPRLSGNGWYVFGDPATAPVLEYAYLSTAQGPQLASRDGWEVLGREFRVVLDFGCGATDHRGAYHNAGGS